MSSNSRILNRSGLKLIISWKMLVSKAGFFSVLRKNCGDGISIECVVNLNKSIRNHNSQSTER